MEYKALKLEHDGINEEIIIISINIVWKYIKETHSKTLDVCSVLDMSLMSQHISGIQEWPFIRATTKAIIKGTINNLSNL